jgi:hypothetical protein
MLSISTWVHVTRTSPALRRGGDTEAKAAEGEKGNATPDLLLKYPNETFATNARKQLKHLQYTSETLVKTPGNA